MKRPSARPLRLGAGLKSVNLGARVPQLPTAMQAGNRERAVMYQSHRWRRERRAFLAAHPICCTPGCGVHAVVVDHVDGHQHADWRLRFWDRSRWQPLCNRCHAAKSAREKARWMQAGEGIEQRKSLRG